MFRGKKYFFFLWETSPQIFFFGFMLMQSEAQGLSKIFVPFAPLPPNPFCLLDKTSFLKHERLSCLQSLEQRPKLGFPAFQVLKHDAVVLLFLIQKFHPGAIKVT